MAIGMMRDIDFLILILLLGTTLTTQAHTNLNTQESCDSYLTEDTFIGLKSSIENLRQSFYLFVEEKDGNTKTQRVSDIQDGFRKISEVSKVFLEARRIQFHHNVRSVDFNMLGKKVGHIEGFVLLPNRETRHNRMALTLKRRHGIDLVFSPLHLAMTESAGAFSPESNEIIVSAKTLDEWPADSTLIHETIHALFLAERKSSAKSKIHFPVHVDYFSAEGLLPMQNTRRPYNHMMSFEELITFSYSFMREALDLKKENNLERINTRADRLKLRLRSFAAIIQNVETASDLALDLLNEGKDFLRPQIQEEHRTLAMTEADDEFHVNVMIPVYEKNSNVKAYVKEQLIKAKELAQFSAAYFDEIDFDRLTAADLEKIIRFRSAQVQYVKKLESP